MVVVEGVDPSLGGQEGTQPDHQHPLHPRQAYLSPLDSHPIKSHLRSRESSLYPPLDVVEMGEALPYLLQLPSALNPSREITGPSQGLSREWSKVSVALTFPTKVRSLAKVPSYKESSSERRIPGP